MAEQPAPLTDRLREALVAEYATAWPFYDQPTRDLLARQAAQMDMPRLLRAFDRAGLVLAEREGRES